MNDEGQGAAETYFERFQLDAAVGNSYYSRVYSATEKATGHPVALKVMRKAEDQEERSIPRSRILAGDFDCANLVQVMDIFEDSNLIFVVMERVDGGRTLFDWIASQGAISEAAVARIMSHLCQGLKTLHDHDIIHRNIKPENILVAETEFGVTVKLSDYYLANAIDKTERLWTLSETEVCCAPEVLAKRDYDKSADIWSLGVIAYILLCGRRPIEEDEKFPLYSKAFAGQISYDEAEWEIISPQGKDFVMKMLQAEPADRMSVHEALHHEWLTMEIEEVAYRGTFKNFQITNMGRTLKKTTGAMVQAANFKQFSYFLPRHDHTH
jgi:serine/threonine protein kinase